MSMLSCTPEQLAGRTAATFSLVPFVARLFTGGPLRGETPPVSKDPAGCTAEVMHRLREIWKRAAWRFLARDCGWRALPSSAASTAVRLWQAPAPPLRFTADAMRLCLALYQATRGQAKPADFPPPACDQASGDLILHHLAFRRLRANPMLAGIPHGFDWSGWAVSPLNAAADPDAAAGTAAAVPWAILTRPDMVPYLPWLLASWVVSWDSRTRDARRGGFEAWRKWIAALRTVTDGLTAALLRHDDPSLPVPLLSWVAATERDLPAALAFFEKHTADLSLTQRHEAAADWHHLLGIAEQLQHLTETCTALHPADREPGHRVFLAAVHASGFAAALQGIRAARQSLRPVLS